MYRPVHITLRLACRWISSSSSFLQINLCARVCYCIFLHPDYPHYQFLSITSYLRLLYFLASFLLYSLFFSALCFTFIPRFIIKSLALLVYYLDFDHLRLIFPAEITKRQRNNLNLTISYPKLLISSLVSQPQPQSQSQSHQPWSHRPSHIWIQHYQNAFQRTHPCLSGHSCRGRSYQQRLQWCLQLRLKPRGVLLEGQRSHWPIRQRTFVYPRYVQGVFAIVELACCYGHVEICRCWSWYSSKHRKSPISTFKQRTNFHRTTPVPTLPQMPSPP